MSDVKKDVKPVSPAKSSMLNAALGIARQGMPIFPCHPINKQPLTEHGFKDATTDEATVRAWWEKNPTAMIGSPTGEITDRVIIDIDSPLADEELQEIAETSGGVIPATLTVQSSAGRKHLYFNYPAGKKVGCSDRQMPGQINVRGNGGYVIIPPSKHPMGSTYSIVDPSPKADLPDWLLALLIKTSDGETLSLKEVTPRWALQKITKSLANLKRCAQGNRNNMLNTTAWWIARLSAHPIIKEEAMLQQLIEIARGIGLDERESRSTASSGWRDGLQCKLTILPIHECTDLGNADRLVLRYGDRMRYVPAYGSNGWLVWDGHRWKPDDKRSVRKLAHETVRAIYVEAAGVEDDEIRKRLVAWANKSEADDSIDAMLKEAGPYLAVAPNELDADPELLNLENGTLDLRTGNVREQRQTDLVTRMIPVRFEPDARCPLFEIHLKLVLPDPQVRDYFLEMIAYSYSGDTGEQCVHVLHGKGENGKSTTEDLFRNMAGDYGTVLRREFFAEGYQGVSPHDVADLLGKRIGTCSEFEEGDVLRVAVMKGLTSGTSSRIRACRKYGHPFEFSPQVKFILDTNHLLRVDSDDHGTWRRIRVIPFSERIPDNQKDEYFSAKLWNERSGVLNLIIVALRRWNARGRKLNLPQAIVKASDVYKQTSSLFEQFIEDNCVCNDKAHYKLDHLASSFSHYAESSGLPKRKILGSRALKERLKAKGFKVETDPKTHAISIYGLGPRDGVF